MGYYDSRVKPPPPKATPRMAETIRLSKTPDGWSLQVDGEEFPWHITDLQVVEVTPHGAPSVQVTIIAETVDVHHSLGSSS